MKVIVPGYVIISPGPIRVEGWVVDREDTDPDIPTEQLLLAHAVKEALQRLQAAVLADWNANRGSHEVPDSNQPQSSEPAHREN
jgi:hypothetical protein